LGWTSVEEEVMSGDEIIVFDADIAVIHAPKQEGVGLKLTGSVHA